MSSIARGLGVRIYREGRTYGFWEAEAKSLVAGDIIVEILPDGSLAERSCRSGRVRLQIVSETWRCSTSHWTASSMAAT